MRSARNWWVDWVVWQPYSVHEQFQHQFPLSFVMCCHFSAGQVKMVSMCCNFSAGLFNLYLCAVTSVQVSSRWYLCAVTSVQVSSRWYLCAVTSVIVSSRWYLCRLFCPGQFKAVSVCLEMTRYIPPPLSEIYPALPMKQFWCFVFLMMALSPVHGSHQGLLPF